jgi:hypothetical protein
MSTKPTKKQNSKKRKYDDDRGTHFFDANVFKKRKLKNAEESNKKSGGFGSSTGGLTELQTLFKKKLEGAKFRYLNEKLYTTTGQEAKKLFEESPELFGEVSSFNILTNY